MLSFRRSNRIYGPGTYSKILAAPFTTAARYRARPDGRQSDSWCRRNHDLGLRISSLYFRVSPLPRLHDKRLGGFFKQDFHSFREFPDFLANRKQKNLANALMEVHRKHALNFSSVMPDGSHKSVRDRITHYGWVDAGTINLTKNGLRLCGGSEMLRPTPDDQPLSLTQTLTVRSGMLRA